MLMRLIPAALTLCLALTACGGDSGGSQTAGAFDPAATAQALLDSGAFSDALEEVDVSVAATLYGVDEADITDGKVYMSLSAGAEEIAVLVMANETSATAAMDGLEKRVADQKAALESYQPDEVAKLDSAILGLGPGDLVLVASRPGMGKTSIGLNIALAAAKATNKTVAVFSLEMTREQLVMRLLAGEALVDSKKLQTGRLTEDEWKRIGSAAGVLSETDIRIDDNPSLTVADMNAQCRRLKNLGLIVVDYLQLMQSAGSGNSWANESRTQAVSDISRMMKIMAKELGVPVLCLSQLSRANEQRQNKRPMLSDLRESGAIEQDADVVMGIYREGYYNQECENPNEAELIILKNRRGQTGTLNMMWLPEYTSFVALDKRHDDE